MCLFLLDGPSLVYVNVFVRSFSKIDDVKMVSTRNVPDLMIPYNLLSPVERRNDISSKTINEIFSTVQLTDNPTISINEIENVSFQEYSFQITLRQQWNDKRLRFDKILTSRGVDLGEFFPRQKYKEKEKYRATKTPFPQRGLIGLIHFQGQPIIHNKGVDLYF